MGSAILRADTLNLPDIFAAKFRGKKIELTETEDVIIIKPIENYIAAARGMLKGGNFGTHTLVEQKRIEKEMGYAD